MDNVSIRARVLVDAIMDYKRIILAPEDRQTVVENVAWLKGRWRSASVDKLRLSANMADDFYVMTKGQPYDQAMKVAATAVEANITGGNHLIRRNGAIIVFAYACSVIRGLEGEKP